MRKAQVQSLQVITLMRRDLVQVQMIEAGAHIMGRYGDAEEPYSWFIGNGTAVDTRSLGAKWLASNGEMYIDGATYNTGGADIAEMFESIDGSAIDPGYFVTLEGDKMRKATASDSYILGVTSATPSLLGNSASLNWQGKYELDEWGRRMYTHIEVPLPASKNGEPRSSVTETKPIISTKWDPSQSYVSRQDRQEWSAVGLLGQLRVRDDGSCQVNGYCLPNDEGIATTSQQGYRVIKRTAANQVIIMIKGNESEIIELSNRYQLEQQEMKQILSQLANTINNNYN